MKEWGESMRDVYSPCSEKRNDAVFERPYMVLLLLFSREGSSGWWCSRLPSMNVIP